MYKMKNGVRMEMTSEEVTEIKQHRKRRADEKIEIDQSHLLRKQAQNALKLKLGLSDEEWNILKSNV